MENNITTKLATLEDKFALYRLIDEAVLSMPAIIEAKNYKNVADHVLSDIDYGFFIIAKRSDEPVGFMFFSYEWSDWRNGMFFWL